jgi:AraC-like DNA-binding protein
MSFSIDLDETSWRPLVEASCLIFQGMLESVLGHDICAATFALACRRPRYAREIENALHGRVLYGARQNAVLIPAGWLTARSPFADVRLHNGTVAELTAALERLERPRDARARTVQLLRTMPDGRLSAHETARMLGMSSRTLVRRLGEARTSYRDLLDKEMKGRASRLLATGDLTRDQMAERLGYEDPTSFSRACRRWFGNRSDVG